MAKPVIIWEVQTGDHSYEGANYRFLLTGDSAAEVEAKALKKHAKDLGKLSKDEPPSEPFIHSVTRIGVLND